MYSVLYGMHEWLTKCGFNGSVNDWMFYKRILLFSSMDFAVKMQYIFFFDLSWQMDERVSQHQHHYNYQPSPHFLLCHTDFEYARNVLCMQKRLRSIWEIIWFDSLIVTNKMSNNLANESCQLNAFHFPIYARCGDAIWIDHIKETMMMTTTTMLLLPPLLPSPPSHTSTTYCCFCYEWRLQLVSCYAF